MELEGDFICREIQVKGLQSKWVHLRGLLYAVVDVGLSTVSCRVGSDFLDITSCSEEDFQSDFLGAIFNKLIWVLLGALLRQFLGQ